MTITVGVPYFGCPDLVERCVRSLLAQTVRDIVVVVLGDGEAPPLEGIRDDRLVVYTTPANRGAYFAQSVILAASPHPWYSPHGADDWSEPDHLEQLLDVAGTDCDAVATGAVWFEKNGTSVEHHAAYEVGLFAKARLEAIGGYNPAERMGQDTLMLRLLRITGEVRATGRPTYHRVKRAGALTTAPATRIGSPARNAMRKRNRAVFAECQRLRKPRLIRPYRLGLIPPALAAELEDHAGRLREVLMS